MTLARDTPGGDRQRHERSTFLKVLSSGRPTGVCLLGLILAVVVLLVDTLVAPGRDVAGLYAAVLLVVSFSRKVGLLILATFVCLAMTFGAPLIWLPGRSWNDLLSDLAWVGSSLVWVSGILVHRLHIEAERDQALAERQEALRQVKVLQGVLRMCAWCRRIQNRDATWVTLEEYVADHSEAAFTHGICPECLGRHRQTIQSDKPSAREPTAALSGHA